MAGWQGSLTGLPPGWVGPPQAAPPSPLAGVPSVGTLLAAFQRCWIRALALGLLAASLGVAAVFFLVPARYTAVARLKIDSRPGAHTWEGAGDFNSFKQSQAALLKSSGVLSPVLADPKVSTFQEVRGRSDVYGWLVKDLTTDFKDAPEILTIRLAGDHPEELAVLLEKVCQTYLDQFRKDTNARGDGRLVDLKQTSKEKHEELARVRANIAEILARLGVSEDPKVRALQQQAAIDSLRRAQDHKSKTELDLTKAESDQKVLQARLDRLLVSGNVGLDTVLVPETAIEAELRKDNRATTFRQRLTKLDNFIERERQKVDPSAVETFLGDEIRERKQLERSLANLYTEARNRAAVAVRLQNVSELRKELDLLDGNVKAYRGQLAVLERNITQYSEEIEKFQEPDLALTPQDKARLDELKARQGSIEIRLQTIDAQVGEMETASSAADRVTWLERPGVPASRTWTRTIKYASLAGIALFGLVAAGLTLLELGSRRVYTSEDITQNLGLPLLGSLPSIPLSARKGLGGPGTAGSEEGMRLMTEAVDAVRTVLLHGVGHYTAQGSFSAPGSASAPAGPRVILITSAVSGEGKTTLASHLAASLARSWRKTLLIDGDLRNPAIHGQFDQPLEPGFCEGLRGEVEFDDLVRPTPVSRLWTMSAGLCDSHAVQALAQEQLAEVFAGLKGEFDFIVIDSSPVLPVADPLLLAKHADAVIFSVLREVSRLPVVHSAALRLQTVGIAPYGAVVIGEKPQGYGMPLTYPSPGPS